MGARTRCEAADLTSIEPTPDPGGKVKRRRFPPYTGVVGWVLTPASIVLAAWLLSHLIYL
jgi:hypothetical protein